MRLLFVIGSFVCLAACRPVEIASPPVDDSYHDHIQLMAATAVPTANPMPSATPNTQPLTVLTPLSLLPTQEDSSQGALPTQTPPIVESTSTATPQVEENNPRELLTPSPTFEPNRIDHFLFTRPIPRFVNGNERADWVDRTYAYGDTQLGEREVHLGVEFVNPRFTPVLAAADGVVLFAGADTETILGPKTDYYGQVVMIAHYATSPDSLAIYTLYGHLQEIQVEAGQEVKAGDTLGLTGSSGIAIGAHLHFEVRVGTDPFNYQLTRNPELWLYPYDNHGALAGRVVDTDGERIYGALLRLRGEGFRRDTFSYWSDRVNADPYWHENFVLGDIPAGEYQLIVRGENGLTIFEQTVEIKVGKTTWVDVELPKDAVTFKVEG